jgi:dolichol-phosphate mannosyltransferase
VYVHGFKWALRHQYEFILKWMQISPRPRLRKYTTLVIWRCRFSNGSRYVTGVNVVNWPLSRVVVLFASVYVRWVTGMKIHDATAGLFVVIRKVLEEINLDKIRFVGYASNRNEIPNLLQKI